MLLEQLSELFKAAGEVTDGEDLHSGIIEVNRTLELILGRQSCPYTLD